MSVITWGILKNTGVTLLTTEALIRKYNYHNIWLPLSLKILFERFITFRFGHPIIDMHRLF